MGNISRRGFLGAIAAATAAAFATELDPEKLLWVPGAKTFFIPDAPRIANLSEMVTLEAERMLTAAGSKFADYQRDFEKNARRLVPEIRRTRLTISRQGEMGTFLFHDSRLIEGYDPKTGQMVSGDAARNALARLDRMDDWFPSKDRYPVGISLAAKVNKPEDRTKIKLTDE